VSFIHFAGIWICKLSAGGQPEPGPDSEFGRLIHGKPGILRNLVGNDGHRNPMIFPLPIEGIITAVI
jgi:hypothetical protein